MRPVTIKNNKFTNTLWLSQALLGLIVPWLLVLAVQVSYWLLAVLPCVLYTIWYNQQTIKLQSHFQFKLKTTGKMMLYTHDSFADKTANEVEVVGLWQLPQVLVIKLKSSLNTQNIHMTVFRSVIGKEQFSTLLVGLSQANAEQIKYHES